jgi:hypothetical protein
MRRSALWQAAALAAALVALGACHRHDHGPRPPQDPHGPHIGAVALTPLPMRPVG